MVLLGALDVYSGYQFYQISIIYSTSVNAIVGILMIVFGILTLCVSFAVWLQKTWAAKVIAGVGAANCVTLIIFGFYLVIIVVALISAAAIDSIRNSRVVEHSNWDDC